MTTSNWNASIIHVNVKRMIRNAYDFTIFVLTHRFRREIKREKKGVRGIMSKKGDQYRRNVMFPHRNRSYKVNEC